MEKSVEIGPEAALSVKVEGGLVKIEIKHDGHDAISGAFIHLKPESLVKKITDAIPGQVDDQLGVLLLAALKK